MRLFIFLSLVVLLSTTVSAKKPKDKNKKEEHQKVEASMDKKEKKLSISASTFTSSEMTTLNNYRYKTTKTLPKGLQKKVAKGGTLPPGWQKKLNKGDVIDSHTFQYAKPLPNEVMIQLPKSPIGTIIVEIDGEIVRLAEATMTIIDILSHP